MKKVLYLVSIEVPKTYRIFESGDELMERSSPIQFWAGWVCRKKAHRGYVEKGRGGKLKWISLTDRSYDDSINVPVFWSYSLGDDMLIFNPHYFTDGEDCGRSESDGDK